MSYSEDASDRWSRNWGDTRPRRSEYRDERLSPPKIWYFREPARAARRSARGYS
jgi:hypothetical protein